MSSLGRRDKCVALSLFNAHGNFKLAYCISLKLGMRPQTRQRGAFTCKLSHSAMSEIAIYKRSSVWAREDPFAMERRIFYGMCATVAVSVLVSAAFAPWRTTTGLLLGGVLSLLNHHWLRTSIVAAFSTSVAGNKPKVRVARFVLRYFVVVATIAAANLLDVASFVAALAGLCSFVVAALVEAFMQTIFAITHREGN